jgi:hypothetical protein
VTEHESKLELLRAFLAERDLPCPLCGYNLRALTAEKCPECGSEVEITVGLTEPRMAAFIAGVVGLASGVGFNTLMLFWVAWMWVIDGRRGPRLQEFLPLLIGLAVMSVALMLWLNRRRRIRAMRPGVSWPLAASGYALSIALAMLFFSVVR